VDNSGTHSPSNDRPVGGGNHLVIYIPQTRFNRCCVVVYQND
jgi:hypothetical protein